MEHAAECAGLTRAAFLAELARRKVDVFVVDEGDLRDELRSENAPHETHTPLAVRRATRKPCDFRLPEPPATPTDSTSLLLEDRGSR